MKTSLIKTKALSSVLAGCMIIATALCGCGGGGSANQKEKDPVEEGATVIQVYTRDFQEWNNESFAARVREFNSILDDGIQVEVKYIAESAFNDTITAARESNNAPDVFIAAYNQVYNIYDKGYALALDDYFTKDELDDIVDNIRPAVQFDGKYYAYPYFTEPSTLLFYSKKTLKAANVSEPSGKWTWEQLLSACKKIKPTLSGGQYVLGMPIGGEIGWATWGMIYNNLGGFPISEDWSTCRLSDPKVAADYTRYLEFYDSIYSNGYSPVQSIVPKGYNDEINALCEGKVAMTVAGSWSIGTIKNEYSDTESDIGVIPMPTEDGDITKTTATNGGWTFLIDSKTKNAEKAAKFVEWLVANQDDMTSIASYFEKAGYGKFPARKSVTKYIESKTKTNKYYSTMKSVAESAVLEPLYPWDISLQMATTMNKMITGMSAGETIAQVISKANSGITTVIKNNKLAGTNPALGAASK